MSLQLAYQENQAQRTGWISKYRGQPLATAPSLRPTPLECKITNCTFPLYKRVEVGLNVQTKFIKAYLAKAEKKLKSLNSEYNTGE